MIAVRIPKEIKAYKEKIVGGLTFRQLFSILVAGSTCIPLYIWGIDFLHEELVSWLVMIIALPCAGYGFFKFNGMPFEKFLYTFFRFYFIVPNKRKYKTENFFKIPEEVLPKKQSKKALSKSFERSFLMIEEEEKRAGGEKNAKK